MSKSRQPSKLTADLAEARVLAAHLQMKESINGLSHSFSSSGLIARVAEHDRGHSRHRLQSAIKIMRASPLPFVLIGAGIALLLSKPLIRKTAIGTGKTEPTAATPSQRTAVDR
tara:strand:+ start:207 stop:548 length:342 start_codon:yes stop_codon:yes gene_type:complete